MRDFLNAVKLLAVDLASTLFFLALFLLTHNIIVSVSLGMALMHVIAVRRVPAMPAFEREALLASTGRR